MARPRALRSWIGILAGLTLAPIGCSSGGGGGSSVGAAPGASTGTPAPTVNTQALAQAEAQRRQDYLLMGAQGGAFYSQIHKLVTGQPTIDRAPIDAELDFMGTRQDTADFAATRILRLAYLFGQDPRLPSDLRQRIEDALLGFKYWIDEPGTDEMVFWSENHQIIFGAAAYLAGHLYPQKTFTNSGLTGSDLASKARPRVVRWCEDRFRFGYSEWNSPVYYPHDLAPLFGLIDFAPEPEVQTLASMAVDILLFDIARLSHRGSFGVSSGRCYEEHKLSGHRQSVGSIAAVAFGTRPMVGTGGSTSASTYVTSRYQIPHALLAVASDAQATHVDRARSGMTFSEGPSFGRGFTALEDGMFWWGMGAYFAPETIVLTRRMLDRYQLWHYAGFSILTPLKSIPDALLPSLSSALSPVSEGSVLSAPHVYTYRSPDGMLSSVQRYRKGQVGFQQHAWQATFDLDAAVFTTAPGMPGRDGPGDWTGSGSLPNVTQVEDVAVILYNPPITGRLIFPAMTHAFFPQTHFDEVVQQGAWTFGRKGDGYVGLYSALPTRWQGQGTYKDQELIADGYRNAWICQLGRRAVDGSFQDFQQAILAAQVTTTGAGNGLFGDPLHITYAAPGLGTIEADWEQGPTLDGQAIPTSGYPRFDNPYSRTPVNPQVIEIQHGGATLRLDLAGRSRTGTGL